MRYRLLGNSGLRVSELCLGTMTFGEEWGWGADLKESQAIYDSFLESGGNFIDTANRYTEGTSEQYLGQFIKPHREKVVLATKYSLYDRLNDPNSGGNHRKNLVQSVEGSLKRLGTDYIDLLYLHAWDFTTPVEEVMRSLDDLVSAGKVLYLGISDTPAWIVSQANMLASLRGWAPFVSLQIEYSLLQRTPERDLIPMAKALDLAVCAWAPLAGGALTGKYLTDNNHPKRLKDDSKRLNEKATTIAQQVVQVADALGCSPAQVAINWVRQQQGLMIPIVGARTLKHLEDNLNCLEHQIPEKELEALNEFSQIALGFPHDFLHSDGVRQVVFGGMFEQIHNHHKK